MVEKGPTCENGCGIAELFRLLGKAHVLHLLYVFEQKPGPKRFVELQDALDISPNTLSERLKELTEAGLLTRTAYAEIPPRVDYEPTAKAKELAIVFDALCTWAEKHTLVPETAVPKASA